MKVLRVAWVLLAVGFVVHFVGTRWATVLELAQALKLWQPIAALLLIVAGKTVYAEIVRLTLTAVGASIGFRDALYAYNVSQLGKYIPGSIWQFVGRYEIYRRHGVDSARIVQVMILENGLMLGTAFLVGLGAVPSFADLALEFLTRNGVVIVGAISILAAAGVAVVLKWRRRVGQLLETFWKNRALVWKVAALFVLMWCLLGLSVVALFAGYADISPAFTISLFSLSYMVGFVAIFAPAGIGVRDVMFTIGLTGLVEPQVALLITIGHRLIYIVADLACGFYAWATSSQGSALPRAQAD
ncbi:lysylphosphatidylglycerol synthase domain-containing protein [Microvirga sp. 2MCAF38]|uniref:lysylphosphatidylglycerol synthase domain-containing protein n=1 Tax=Microvirga sp. 2MCAF38 TaxID=3232989 RepID=UPI003F978D82